MAKRLELQLKDLIAAYEAVALQAAYPDTPEKRKELANASFRLASFVWQHRDRITVIPAGVDTPTYAEWRAQRSAARAASHEGAER